MTDPTMTPEERAKKAAGYVRIGLESLGTPKKKMPQEALDVIAGKSLEGLFERDFREAERAAADREREGCAELCEGMGSWRDWYYHKPKIEFLQGAGGNHAAAASYLAQQIRARKEEGG